MDTSFWPGVGVELSNFRPEVNRPILLSSYSIFSIICISSCIEIVVIVPYTPNKTEDDIGNY